MLDGFFGASAHAGTTLGTVWKVGGSTLSPHEHKHAARADVNAGTVTVTLVVIDFDRFPFGFILWAHSCHAKSLSLTRNQPRINKNLPLGADKPYLEDAIGGNYQRKTMKEE